MLKLGRSSRRLATTVEVWYCGILTLVAGQFVPCFGFFYGLLADI